MGAGASYRPQGEVMFSEVCHSVHNWPHGYSVTVMALSVRILLERFLVITMATETGGTDPTGMHSCLKLILKKVELQSDGTSRPVTLFSHAPQLSII